MSRFRKGRNSRAQRKRRIEKITKTQHEALRELRTSKEPGFGVFSSNANADILKPADRMYFIMRVPGLEDLPRLTINTPEMAKALIEDLIAHRRHVWPNAAPIDPDVQLED